MLLKELNNTVLLIWSDRIARLCFFFVLFSALLISCVLNLISSVLIILCYFCGCIVSFCVIKYRFEVGFCLTRLTHFYYDHVTPKKQPSQALCCNICDSFNCKRHQNVTNTEPWTGLMVNEDLNDAVEQFYNKILEKFISSWYSNFTTDLSFVDKLRVSFRYASATLLKRYYQINIGELLTDKLIPYAVRHIDDCFKIEKKSTTENLDLKEVVINHFGKRLHVTVTNRENELEYLRQLTTFLLPKLLTKTQCKCDNFAILMREIISAWVFLPIADSVSDPNVINLLVNVICNSTSSKMIGKTTNVELLHNFINYDTQKAALGYDLSRIFKTPDVLYCFMQFLKEEEVVNLLQFCLDVEEFNRKLLTPDLNRKDLDTLHSEATQLYNLYLNEQSSDFIGCSIDICRNFNYLLQAGSYNIPKLRTSTPLYNAYDYAFNLLETKWLPTFYHSNEFYKLMCGQKITSNYQKSQRAKIIANSQGSSPVRNRLKKPVDVSNPGPVSKLSSGLYRIKGALRTQPIDGSAYPTETSAFETGSSVFIEQNIFRDLSVWRVSISHTSQISIPKPTCIFHVNIKRIDSCSESERSWTVQRYDQDFYTLKLKLVEFHGENEICDSPLPSRRSTTPLETRKQKYEEFLQKLLQKPSLRGSELLYTFLTTKENFTLLADTSVTLVSDLENIYQSVAHKLRKEKGQNLDSFMTTFLTSTETKSKLNKFDSLDLGEEADSGILIETESSTKIRNLTGTIFENNFDVPLPDSTVYTPTFFNPTDIIQCFSYLLNDVFRAPNGIQRIFNSICSITYQTVEFFTRLYIERELKLLLPQHKLAHYIHLLEDLIFESEPIITNKFDLERRKINAFENLRKLKTGFICHWSGLEINAGLERILNVLQHPQLNKQLFYSLLDIIILELYPDCNLIKNCK